jgi:hypothetical protein
MKTFLTSLFLLALFSCDTTQQTDNEKEKKVSKIEITDNDGKDSVTIKLNSKDGLKIEGKDGKVELKTGDGGKINVEKKGKEINIEIKEN